MDEMGGSKELTSSEQTNKEQGLSEGIPGTGREAGAGRRAESVPGAWSAGAPPQ